MCEDRFQKVGLFPPGLPLGRGVVDGPDWEKSQVSPAQLML